MTETIVVTIFGFISTVLSGVIFFVLGKRYERHQQTLLIRAEMLKPVEEWLEGVEKMNGIFGDTLSSIVLNSPFPITYNYDERRKAAQFMSEKTNRVLGILQSKSLQTSKTIGLAKQLSETINDLNNLLIFKLLPKDNEILDRGYGRDLSPDFVAQITALKQEIDSEVKNAYSLVAQMKTSLA